MADWANAGSVYELNDIFDAPAAQQEAAPPTFNQPQAQTYPQQQPYVQPQSAQPYQQQQQQQNYGGGYNSPPSDPGTPKMGILKVFSIVGVLFSLVVFFMGVAVMNLYASGCYNCDCYPYVRNNEEYGLMIILSGVILLTFSVIAMVKAFKKY